MASDFVFDEDKIKFLFEFDDNATDTTGNYDTTVNGNITYENGYFGKGANFSDGYISIEDCNVGKESVTMSAWVKTDKSTNKRIIMSSADEAWDRSGFSLMLGERDFQIEISDETLTPRAYQLFQWTYYPIDMYDGWVHMMMVVDREKKEFTIYYDFKKIFVQDITTDENISLSGTSINIGQDGTGLYPNALNATLDDLFIYNGAFTDADVAKLEEYYNKNFQTEKDPTKLEGASLVLDGRIGLKVYTTVDESAVDSAELKVVTVNEDYKCTSNSPNYSSLYRVESVAELTKDEEKGQYYAILYAHAKDIDNISFEIELNANMKNGTTVPCGSATLSIEDYIAAAKELAEDGEEIFVEALPLIESLETYGNYAENYFNGGHLDSYMTSADSVTFKAPTKSNVTLDGATFYGTSILLEDNVTIRHYFTVDDIDAFNASYTCDIAYGIKGGFIYFDITDINAQSIGVPQTLVIYNLDGSVAFEVSYSVGNYIANQLDSTDTRLASLVNAMYDYYVEAYSYNGSTEFVTDRNEAGADIW